MAVEVDSGNQAAVLPEIWIVDDSPLEAELVRRMLAHLYRVEVFTDGAAVIEQFANDLAPDAVVLDWQMPGISGIDVCKFLRGRPQTQSIPILMLTVQQETGDLVQCLAAGADDFLSKPCSAAELSARVAALVRSRRLHERAQSAERALRSLLMQLPEGVISVDAAGCVTFVNLEAQRMLAAHWTDVVGKPLREFLPAFVLEQKSPTGVDSAILPDLVLRGRVFAPAIRHYAGIDTTETTLSFRDVTSEREDGQRRTALLLAERAARAQAEQASRAKDEFLAVVSHELRTPLNAILGWTRLVRSGSLDEGKRARALETIERNATTQQKLIEDILDVSRIIAGKMVLESCSIDLPALVRTSLEAVRPAAEAKGVELTMECADQGPFVAGDPSRLQQTVSNILSNAVKFTPRGGSISVRVGVLGDSARIQIRDTGQGIGRDLLPLIFDRFSQGDGGTSRSHSGLGLGLSIVRHLVELHGGSVQATSDGKDRGATFTLLLPVAERSAGDPVANVGSWSGQAPRAYGGESLKGVRLLVVDDDEDARDLVVTLFQQLAAEAISASSVEEGMRAVQAFRPMVIVSDIGMPVEDGYAFIARVRELPKSHGGGVPAVALTAFAAQQDGERAIAAGFDAYLPKPVDAGRLVLAVRLLVSGAQSSGQPRPAS